MYIASLLIAQAFDDHDANEIAHGQTKAPTSTLNTSFAVAELALGFPRLFAERAP